MRAGGGHAKGSEFERHSCKGLSLFYTKGWRDDVLWRTALSGGRATLQLREGIVNRAQAGDIGAIDREGLALVEQCLIECKSYKDLQFPQAITKGTGLLAEFYRDTQRIAKQVNKTPVLIARQNRIPAVILCPMDCEVFTRGRIALLYKLGAQMFLFDEATYMVRRRKVV